MKDENTMKYNKNHKIRVWNKATTKFDKILLIKKNIFTRNHVNKNCEKFVSVIFCFKTDSRLSVIWFVSDRLEIFISLNHSSVNLNIQNIEKRRAFNERCKHTRTLFRCELLPSAGSKNEIWRTEASWSNLKKKSKTQYTKMENVSCPTLVFKCISF